MEFPVLKLPYLAIQEVLPYLSFEDLIDFSLCSKRCKRLIQSMRHPYIGISVSSLSCNRHSISIETRNWNKGHCWQFFLKPLKRGQLPEPHERRRIGGIDIRYQKIHLQTIYSTTTPVTQVRVVFDYLQELFKNLPIHSFCHLSFRTHRTISPKTFALEKCQELHLSDRDLPIPEDHLRYILEKVQVTKYFYLNLPKNPDFRFDFVKIEADEVYFDYAHWVSRETFLAIDSTRILIARHNLTTNDLEDFITQWLHSTSTRLVWLKAFPSQRRPFVDISKFQTRPWDYKARSKYFGLTHVTMEGTMRVDCSRGLDLVRSDGLMASIVNRSLTTYFVVWHERFHDMEQVPDD